MTPEHVRLLYDYNSWANRRTLDACASLSDEQRTRDLGVSFRSVQGTLLHIGGGEWFWLERWQGRSPSVEDIRAKTQPLADLANLRAAWEILDRELRGFVAGFDAEKLASVFHYTTTEGQPNSQAWWQMFQHLANHGSYHRGQITTMLRQLGATPVATDLIAFYRERNGGRSAEPLDPPTLRLLYDYNSWANRRMLDACAALSAEQFTRDLRSSFASVRDTAAHIYGAEWLWLERFHERSPSALPTPADFPDLAALRVRWEELGKNLLTFVGSQSAADLARVYEFRTTRGVVYPSALWPALQHVPNHGTYHRGQVAAMLRQLGAKPNFTDLIYFYRERAGQALD